MIQTKHNLAGVAFGWHIDSNCAEPFARFLERVFYCENAAAAPAYTIDVRCEPLPSQSGWHPCTPEVMPRIKVMKQGDDARLLIGKEAACELDLATGTGVLWLTPAFWELPRKRQQEWPLLALIQLLRERGRYSLHASAVAKNESGVLIAGPSGAGKSTLGLGLIRSGWRQIADDVTLFSVSSTAPTLWGLARGAACGGDPSTDQEEDLICDGKYWYEPDRLYPGKHGKPAELVACIFPKIKAGTPSQLLPLDRLTTLTQLLEYSGGILSDRKRAAKQLSVLKQVAEQVPGFILQAGEDLLADPGIVVELLSQQGVVIDD